MKHILTIEARSKRFAKKLDSANCIRSDFDDLADFLVLANATV